MAKPKKTEVTIDSLLDRYIDPVVERLEKEKAETHGSPSEGSPSQGGPSTGSPNEGCPSQGPLANSLPPESDHSDGTPVPVAPVLPPERSFTRAANWLWDMLPQHIPSLCDWAIYTYLYRLSIGYNQTSCVVSRSTIQKSLGLGRNTVIRSIASLKKRGFITEGLTTQEGTEITLFVPIEVLGSPSQGPPSEGSPSQGPPPRGPAGSPSQGPPSKGPPKKGQLKSGGPSQGPPSKGHIKDSSTFKNNNNRQDVVAVLQEAGYAIDPVTVAAWIGKGVTVETIQRYIDYIREHNRKRSKNKIENPTGWLFAAVESGWMVDTETMRQTAASSQITQQIDTEEQRREAERQQIEARMAELGLERLEQIRQEELAKCQHDPGYRAQPSDRMRGYYVESLVHMRILAEA